MWRKTIKKTHFFYVLHSAKTWVFDQSEHIKSSIYIINWNRGPNSNQCSPFLSAQWATKRVFQTARALVAITAYCVSSEHYVEQKFASF